MFLNGEICNSYINLSPTLRLIPDSDSVFQFRVLFLPPQIECRPPVAQTSKIPTQVKYPNVTISSRDISYFVHVQCHALSFTSRLSQLLGINLCKPI